MKIECGLMSLASEETKEEYEELLENESVYEKCFKVMDTSAVAGDIEKEEDLLMKIEALVDKYNWDVSDFEDMTVDDINRELDDINDTSDWTGGESWDDFVDHEDFD